MALTGIEPEPIRSELAARIASMRALAGRAGAPAIAAELESIRRVAQANGITPAVPVIHALDSALARGEHGALVGGWLDLLGDAVGCGRSDAEAAMAFAAACSVRLVG